MSAFVTQGAAPLATTFYVSCASGLAYDVVFGDGTDLGSNGVSQSSCDGGLQSVAHTYTAAGSYTAQLVVFVRNSVGTISSGSVAKAKPSPGERGVIVIVIIIFFEFRLIPTADPDAGCRRQSFEVTLQYNADSSGCETSIQWGDGIERRLKLLVSHGTASDLHAMLTPTRRRAITR